MKAVQFTHLTCPAVEPSGTVISLEVDESDCRALAAGTVPDHVKAQCVKTLEWFDIDDKTGYAKYWSKG